MRLSLSVEETNRLRQKLGLSLIDVHANSQDENERINRSEVAKEAERLHVRINQAELKSRDRSLHQKEGGTAGELEADLASPESVESTESWLKRMREQKESEFAGEETPSHVRLSSPKTNLTDNSERQKHSADKVSTDSRNLPLYYISDDDGGTVEYEGSALNSMHELSGPTKSKPAGKDPLEPTAPSGVGYNSKPALKPQKAIFKPKKSRTLAKSRTRQLSLLDRPKSRPLIDETSEFDAMLLRNTPLRKASLAQDLPKEESYIFNSEQSNQGVTISSVASLLGSLESEVAPSPEMAEDKKPKDGPHDHVVEAEKPIEDSAGEPAVSTHLSGVASLLQELRSSSGPAVKQSRTTSKGTRLWAKKISRARQAREEELKQAELEFRNLPPKERHQALELQKERLIRENAAEAQELEKHYQPNITLAHQDEHGNELSSKEAFKELSRAFHGNQGKP